MKPNLVAVNASRLSFYADLPLDNNLVNEVRRVSKPDEDGDSAFLDSYSAERHGHRVIAWVISPAEKENNFRISFSYSVGRFERLPKREPKLGDLIDILSNLKQVVEFQCEGIFQFRRREGTTSVVSLPLRISQSPVMPFDEIRGLRLVKLEGSKVQYSVILDLTPDGTLYQNVAFLHSDEFSRTLADSILNKAVDISKKFIIGK